jgi:hypothetical protein
MRVSIAEMSQLVHRTLVAAVAAVALAGVLAPVATGAADAQVYVGEARTYPFYPASPNYRSYRYVPNDEPSVYQSPDLLLPGFFPPWVPGCFQTRAVRTPVGWARERIWVCS